MFAMKELQDLRYFLLYRYQILPVCFFKESHVNNSKIIINKKKQEK